MLLYTCVHIGSAHRKCLLFFAGKKLPWLLFLWMPHLQRKRSCPALLGKWAAGFSKIGIWVVRATGWQEHQLHWAPFLSTAGTKRAVRSWGRQKSSEGTNSEAIWVLQCLPLPLATAIAIEQLLTTSISEQLPNSPIYFPSVQHMTIP